MARTGFAAGMTASLIGTAALALPGAALAGSVQLVRAHASAYPAAEVAAARAEGGDPGAVQTAYDRARDLQEAVRAAAPVSADCRALLTALSAYAAGRVREQEGVDRLSATVRRAGRAQALRARTRVRTGAPRCRSRSSGRRRATRAMSPGPGEASFGAVVARAVPGARRATLVANGRPVAEVAVRGGRARFTLDGPAGRYDLRVVFTNGRTLGARTAAGVRLLPASARAARPGTRIDADRQAALSRALSRGPAHRAAWVQDLTDGTVASANAGARFPAASVVKLGLLAGVLARVPGDAGRSPIGQDLRAVAHWSSNLAANRLVRRYGLGIASTGLRRLGARESTYTGEYIVGTELQPGLPAGGIGSTPPVVSARVTTTRDLARMLYSIHASAVGVRAANRRTGLSVTDARQALGWLLASEQRGDNASLLAGGAGGAPIAQKNGWLRAARHAAGIVYAEGGPRIVVVMTYDAAGVSLPDARVLGARVAGVAG